MKVNPIVYVETNFLLSYIFEEMEHHQAALDLFNHAREDECELWIPYVALVEAEFSTKEQHINLQKRIGSFKSLVENVASIRETLSSQSQAWNEIWNAVDRYAHKAFDEALDRTGESPFLHKIYADEQVFRKLNELRKLIRLSGKDLSDLHVLAAVLRHAETISEPIQPRIFLSLNKGEFDPTRAGAKVPKQLYENARLAYGSHFNLQGALMTWTNWYKG
jgi:predicted nucleic acid-binding protein